MFWKFFYLRQRATDISDLTNVGFRNAMRDTHMKRSFLYWSLLSVLSLFGIILTPNSLGRLFDGLPWSTPVEFLVVGIIVPWLLLLHRPWLGRASVGLSLLGLLLFKIVLAGMTPSSGWDVWVYTSQSNMVDDQWQRTYATLLNPRVSTRFTGNWESKRDFPIEWANDYSYDPANLWVGMRWEGYLRLPADSQFVIVAEGADCGEVTIYNDDGSTFVLPIVSNIEASESIPFASGEKIHRIKSEVCFHGEGNWSLIPLIRFKDGSYISADKSQALWATSTGARLSNTVLNALTVLSDLVDWALIFFLGAWFFGAFLNSRRALFFGGLAAGGFCLLFQPFVVPSIIRFERTGILYVGFWIAVVGLAGLMLFLKNRSENNLRWGDAIHWLLYVFAPLIFSFFMSRWWSEVGRVEFMQPGDDWYKYQIFARQIFVGGDWLHRTVSVFLHQPLYRYVVGLMHVFFGQSTVSLYLLNLWAILVTAVIIVRLAKYFQVSRWVALLFSWVYLVVVFNSTFFIQIERGLTEHVALLFLMATAYMLILYRNHQMHLPFLFLAIVFGLMGTWTRLVYGLMIAVLSCLLLEPTRGWRDFFQKGVQDWRVLLTYNGVIGFGLALVGLRNKILGGEFVLTQSQIYNSGRVENTFFGYFEGIVIVLSGGPFSWEGESLLPLLGGLPGAIILWSGTILALIGLVYRRGWLQAYPLSQGFILLSGILPYAFFLPVAYPPRWSIHLLPWAILSLALGFSFWRRATVAQIDE